MQSLKKFYFGKQKVKVPNTFIGGIGNTINTPALLAAKLGIAENRIKLFKVTGVDVECAVIGGSYSLPRYAFVSDQSITYYIDIDGLNTEIYQAFINSNNLKTLYFPNLTSLRGGTGGGWLVNPSLIRAYFPRLIYMGETVGQDEVFRSGYRYSDVLYVPDVHRTSNSGNADGDIQRYVSNGFGASIRYVTNFTPPNTIANLSTGTIYNTAVQLNFTPPTSVNGVDFYEVYINGERFNSKEIKSSGDYIAGLTASTNYNIRIVAVDMFYNKSELSNTVNVTTTNTVLDVDANAYMLASNNERWQPVINSLFTDLKSQGLYNKIPAFYPFLGTTPAQHKWNAKNPLDTNAAFRLQFFGGGTHSNLGYQCNGTNAYANTFLVPSLNQNVNSNGLTVVVGTNIVKNGDWQIGCYSSSSVAAVLTSLYNTSFGRICGLNNLTYAQQTGVSESRGVYTGSKTATNLHKLFRNTTQVAVGSGGGTLPNIPIFIGGINSSGSISTTDISNKRIQFTAIHEGLTDAEVVALHTIIDNFETAIGRKTW